MKPNKKDFKGYSIAEYLERILKVLNIISDQLTILQRTQPLYQEIPFNGINQYGGPNKFKKTI